MFQPETNEPTGGCQCGAVRFRAGRLGGASICHCRMCQKQFGSFFGPFVTGYDVQWTRGQPKWFRSSQHATRGFCGDCGTPLAYHQDGDEGIVELAIGALDNPTLAPPLRSVNPRDQLPFFVHLSELPTRARGEKPEIDAFNDATISYQHPDHDTAEWPPRGR
jgi:hypothetical protein